MLNVKAHIEKENQEILRCYYLKGRKYTSLTWKLLYLYNVPPVYIVTRPIEATSTYWFGKRNKFTQQPLATQSLAKAS